MMLTVVLSLVRNPGCGKAWWDHDWGQILELLYPKESGRREPERKEEREGRERENQERR